MNCQLENYARQTLKESLSKCTEPQQQLFKQMYSYNNLSIPIKDIVDAMAKEKLDWAMQQVERTLTKNAA